MDVEKTMEFILQNLADVAVKQARSERQIHGIQNLLKIGMRQLVNLAVAQKRTDKAVRDVADSVKELAAAQKRTDARFQRWLDRGSNGKSR
jgi:hypothetical protein